MMWNIALVHIQERVLRKRLLQDTSNIGSVDLFGKTVNVQDVPVIFLILIQSAANRLNQRLNHHGLNISLSEGKELKSGSVFEFRSFFS